MEIHADNEESFVDKNVSFTMYKIGESPGGEWLINGIYFIVATDGQAECKMWDQNYSFVSY